MKYYMIDAFTNERFGGNPAGVVIYQQLDEVFMQSFATEVGFSETAYVQQLDSTTFDVRFFTPNKEVELCGHATIATFKALLEENIVKENHTYLMKTIAGIFTITLQNSFIIMEQDEPLLGRVFDCYDELASLFQLSPSSIGDDTFHLVPQAASTGLWDIMLPIKTREALYAMIPDFEAITAFTIKYDVAGIHAFTLDTERATAESRNFCPRYDINEEAATGTSTGALTYYLVQSGINLKQDEFHLFLQGDSMGRPSTIMTKMIMKKPAKVLVSGQAVILSKGRIY